MNSAPFWKRFIAITIDIVLLNFLLLLLSIGMGFVLGGMMQDKELMLSSVEYLAPVGVLTFWLYFALQESSSKQATLGKRLMGIYVASTDKAQLTFLQASIRHFSKYLSTIFFIGFIMAAFTQKKQALHDMIADALVLKKNAN